MHGSDVIALQHNESYWLLDEVLLAAYSSVTTKEYSTYADYSEIAAALARYAGVQADQILVTPGSDAAIRVLAELYAKDGKRVLLPVPTFYGYERIFKTVGLAYDTVCYRENGGQFIFPTEATITCIQEGTDVVFLCQPNNPLGSRIPQEDLDRILDAAQKKGTTVVIDEAYFEFAETSSIGRLSRQPLIILRTLSKAFGLAGARVGYCIARSDTVAALRERMLPWPVAHSSAYAALRGLEHIDHIRERVRAVIAQRDVFMAALRELPRITPYSSETNFILMRVPDSGSMQTTLSEQGIMVARGDVMSGIASAQDVLRNTIRASVPSAEHLGRVIECMKYALDNTAQSVL
ncbi:MAG: histidinol-phosphate aminotransferase [Candidatus Kaiserbacteria bacterium]|nr:histidinol-phosphate aminotransferase [Candidatus Kaiserbacteria bacterium]